MINISDIGGNLTPLAARDLYHRICFYSPIEITPLLLFNVPYTLFIYLGWARSLFGDFSGDSMKDKLLRAMFSPEGAIGKILITNIAYLVVVTMLFPA
jgi:hypothetical protein